MLFGWFLSASLKKFLFFEYAQGFDRIFTLCSGTFSGSVLWVINLLGVRNR